jgi:hypothetical protein
MESMRIDFAQASLAFSGDRRALEDHRLFVEQRSPFTSPFAWANALTSLSQKFQRASELFLREP